MMKRLRSYLKRLAKDKEGASLAEIALATPLLLFLTFGAFEMSLLLYQQQVVTRGVQEAARFVARSPTLYTDATCSTTIPTAVSNKAKELAVRGFSDSSNSLIAPNFDESTVTVTVTCQSISGQNLESPTINDVVPIITVTASFQPSSTTVFTGILISGGALTLTAEHQEMGIGL